MLSTISRDRRAAPALLAAAVSTWIVAGAHAQVQPSGGRITFTNGDTLKGHLRFIDSQMNLAWDHPLVGGPILVSTHNVSEIIMPPSDVKLPDEKLQRLDLNNGDQIRGKLQALDAETATFMAVTAGLLKLPRRMLLGLNLGIRPSGLTYSGPSSIEEWVTSSLDVAEPWQFHDGALHSYSMDAIGRNVNLPDRASIEFSTTSLGPPMMRFTFYTSQLQHPNGAGYYLLIGQKDIFLGRHGPGLTGNDTSGGKQYKFDRSGRAIFRILSNLETHEVILLIDGNVVDRWKSPGDVTPSGRGIVFYPKSRNALAVGDIRVTRWNGRVPKPVVLKPPGAQDRIRFANGDIVEGTIASIGPKAVVLETSGRKMDIPIERVARFEFAQRKRPADDPGAGLTRLELVDGSRITMKITGMDGRLLSGDIAGGSHHSLPAVFVRELKFKTDATGE